MDIGASSRRTRNARFLARRYDFPDFISAVKSIATRYQSYKYILSEIFMTCGTQLNIETSKCFYPALVNKSDSP